MVTIEHPLGGERSDGVTRRARQAVDQITRLLSVVAGSVRPAWIEGGLIEELAGSARPITPAPASSESTPLEQTAPDFITVADSAEAVLAAFCEHEWCDGLPIVPPTED